MRLWEIKMLLFTFVFNFILLYYRSKAENKYTNKWFGDFLQYKCHCKNSQCDSDGYCKDGICEKGCFGYKCQYKSVNFATRSNYYPWLMDDNESTCNNNSSHSSLYLTLDDAYIFTWMRLIFISKDPFRLFTLKLSTQSNSEIECPDQKIVIINSKTVDVWCSLYETITNIHITGESVTSLCSVYISKGRNVALRQTTTQTSTDYNGPSYKAVDGNTSGIYSHNSCTHTDVTDTMPTWTLDLNSSYLINRIVIYNRDCPKGKWGLDCNKSCPTECLDFCKIDDGYCQDVCLVQCNQGSSITDIQNENENTGILIGSTVAVIIFLLSILSFIYLWRKLKQFRRTSTQRCPVKSLLRKRNAPSQGYSTSVVEDRPSSRIGVECTINTSNETRPDAGNTSVNQPVEDSSISISEFNQFMAKHPMSYLWEQFEEIPSAESVSMENAKKEENKSKNRYKNICPYDHSRVILNIDEDKDEGDYINASYIKGYNGDVEFIASQGPNEFTVNDFVRMLWECNVEQIVMLTDLIDCGKSKCEMYWPEDGKKYFGEIKVRLVSTVTMSDYTIRSLELVKKHEYTQQLTHYQFHSWPDKSVPDAPWSLLDFAHMVSKQQTTQLRLVHCSAGVGRTGTFIALLNIMKQAKETGKMNFFQTVANLRQDRIFMVQTEEQYEFLHKAALAALQCVHSTITMEDLMNKINILKLNHFMDNTRIEAEFKDLCNVCEIVNTEVLLTGDDGKESDDQNKERDVQPENNSPLFILPRKKYRLLLNSEPDAMSGYINAVRVQGLKQKDQSFITQLPKPDTVDDFWRLVTQYNINVVVTFEQDMISDQTIGQFLPTLSSEVLTTPLFEIKSNNRKQTLLWDEQRLTVNIGHKSENKTHEVVCVQILFKDLSTNKWWNVVKHLQSSNVPKGRIAYLCNDGEGRTGIFIALLNILAQAKATGKMNFLQTVAKLIQDRVFMVQNSVVCSDVNKEEQLDENDDDNVYQNTQKLSLKDKNRSPSVRFRPYLNTSNDITDDYIHAVIIQGVKQRDQYFLTHLPMSKTVDDFWRLVTQYKINVIVAFEMDDFNKDKNFALYVSSQSEKYFETPLFKLSCDTQRNTTEQRVEKIRVEKIRVEKIRVEKIRVEKIRVEKIRVEKIRVEKIRVEKDRVEKIRVEKIRVEKIRVEKIRVEKIRVEKIRVEKIRVEKIRVEKIRVEKIRVEKIRVEKIRVEKIRVEKIRVEKIRVEKIRVAKVRVEKIRVET
ncbi:hypothetical protein Btru_033530 [Bulinus truncatus]|nr:hypothetical protein Btru_033530 [Bulinus truncatus]